MYIPLLDKSMLHQMKLIQTLYQIDERTLKASDLPELLKGLPHIELSEVAIRKIVKCRTYLETRMNESDEPLYGINTGFGYMQKVSISDDQTAQLQHNLLLSHACGVGEEVPLDLVRTMMLLKIKALAEGYSGIRLETVERLLFMLKEDIIPVVYNQGSLGASGDLCPLSHMVLPLIGKGMVNYRGKKLEAAKVLAHLGIMPLSLGAKEGLALINGTQFMLAYAADMVNRSRRLLSWSNLIGAMSMEAFGASHDPLFEGIHLLRKQEGQIQIAAELRKLLQGSELHKHFNNDVQDPYSFRCIPQVHGASVDALNYVENIVNREINAVTDNPLIFPDEDRIVSGGNFHGQPLALVLDQAAIALAELGNISERRVFQLLSGQRSLPLFLIREPGLNSGLMIAQYTAASLVSENKQLCTPASVDSIVSSNGQEDHVSMGANAATQCRRVVENVEKILAIELLTACQALSFRRPHQSSVVIEEMYEAFRKKVTFNEADRLLHEDIHKAINFIQNQPLKF